jgi:hypothetical protein
MWLTLQQQEGEKTARTLYGTPYLTSVVGAAKAQGREKHQQRRKN